MIGKYLNKSNLFADWLDVKKNSILTWGNKRISQTKNDDGYGSLQIGVCLLFFAAIVSSLLWLREHTEGDHPIYGARIGAICRDGWKSNSVGPGTCSWHGGVSRYIREEIGYSYANKTPYQIATLCLLSLMVMLSVIFHSVGIWFFSRLLVLLGFFLFWLFKLTELGVLIVIGIPLELTNYFVMEPFRKQTKNSKHR